ncbi:MAG TPA: hypothetical protein VMN81_12520 [Vicinamibacterales bacterium]|nr:hypothetical protein [Vicinamibacterales bacterium]
MATPPATENLSRPSVRPPVPTAWHAAALYAAAALAWTWPLAPNIATAIAWDLGDPMLVAWVMGWVNDSVLALARGDAGRFLAMWDAPIFHPEPVVLAFSEHMIPQALFVLPLHAATGNIILCYNVALLGTFVLSGVGMFLLARELTGSAPAGLLAGAIFAFTPYRVDQLSHLHILSSQWMPFALFGLRRYFTTRRLRPLVWATLALVALNLSSGYYLFFFTPFLVAYVIGEMRGRRLLGDRRTWAHLAGAGAASAMLTLPFLIPYLAARSGEVGRRSYGAIRQFSADVYAYVTGPVSIPWYRDLLDAMRDAPENAAFPGAVAVLMAVAAMALLLTQALRRWQETPARDGWRGPAIALLLLAAAASIVAILWIGVTGGRIIIVAGHEVRLRNLGRFAMYGSVAILLAAALSARLRAAFRGRPGSLAAGALVAAFAALLLSLGPRMESMNEFIGYGPYAILLKVMPGFDGLRVPSRYAMIVVFWLAVAGAYAAAAMIGRARWALAAVLLLTGAAMVESRPSRFALDSPFYEPDVAPLSMTPRLRAAEPLYVALRELPRGVLLELPWGTTGWDIQYMHAQRRHGWPLVNGFSGYFPQTYMRTDSIRDALVSPDRAWWALERSGASHVIVHEWAFPSIDRGRRVSQWLRDGGAVEVTSTENDRLFRLPGGTQHR